MAATEESIWAEANPRGMIEPDPGPTFWLWNFGVDEDQPKPEHIRFIAQTDFLVFMTTYLRLGRRIEITGLASSSGASQSNTNLSLKKGYPGKGVSDS